MLPVLLCCALCQDKPSDKPYRKGDALKKVREYQEQLKNVGAFAAHRLEVGKVGRFYQSLEVLQILSNDEMLVQFWTSKKGPYYMRGVDTSDLVDGKMLKLRDVFEITGTYKYGNVAGSTRTVYRIEPWQPKNRPTEEELRLADMEEKEEVAAESARLAREAEIRKQQQERRLKEDQAAKEDARKKAEAEAPKKAEVTARARLKLIRELIDARKFESAQFRIDQLIKEFPKTEAAKEAKELRKKAFKP